ncbi:MAG: dTDP-4-dehydrorhamnose reductase [Niameybacter sp.]|uniref:dTDP-4-dehydrorhamnose reductase n=1 Tax=Niameybacter sp. TaxID=2033640 RepID=UPI002FCAA35E
MGTMSKVWISGANGRLGSAMNALLNKREYEILNTDVEEVDITNAEDVMTYGTMNRPGIIINCAGYTDLEGCESNPEKAYQVNALGARNISIVARKIGAKLIHISTDDVFDGEGHVPYGEFDRPTPKSVYGKSKLAGEQFVRDFAEKYMIIRSSWVYGEGENFVQDLLDAAKIKDTLRIANDQYASPTSSIELAKLVMHLMEISEYGLYHGTCSGSCSRYEFAKEVLKLAGVKVAVEPVPTKHADFTNARPAYTVLDNFMLRIATNYKMADWKAALEIYMKK